MRNLVQFFWVTSLLLAMYSNAQNASTTMSPELFKVDASVANQSDAERLKATKAGFTTVITRLVSDPAALQNTEVRQAVDQATNYLTQFNYTSDTNLALQFSQPAIIRLLQHAQLISVPHLESQQELVLHIINVQDFAAFKQVQTYLKSLSGVQKVQLLAIDKNDMQVGLKLSSDQASFEALLSAGNKLQVTSGEKILPLSFIWHP